MELSDVLSGKEEVKQEVKEPEVKQEPESEVKAEPERPRGPDGKFLPKEEVKEEPKTEPKVETPKPVVEFTPKERALLRAAEEERRKRQELEKKLSEMQPQEKKTFWDDPEAALNTFKQEMSSAVISTRVATAENIARSRHQDYDEKVEIFKQIAAETPGLKEQCFQAPDPAEFAYKIGKNYKDLHDAGGLDSLRTNLEKEIRLKLEQEYKDKEKKLQEQRNALPGSLSEVPGAQSANRPVWSGPTPLNDILTK